uniref:Small glutamine-rich tetratricopeptide repeat-containing protein alpha isoform X1 n=1 Tax=Petromyzon marinus TaxID=7757 RepID=A0AAJ7U1B7_PETMA|nr:small glutamine-rich tetratricopeptide repeat-containing protein alpha isoform X1 [Petromyzon marinus]XP_032826832.1 small glutamine-rich tetratricopeptide repeat-containing protein alpha isoform X1 [Petromyzon marinus]
MSDVQRLAVAVLGFLNEQLRAGTLSEDATESLEVATQCLETAFGVSAADSHLAVSRPLLDIFVEATQDEPASNPPLSQEKALPDCTVSEEDRTRADKYKNEGNQYMREERYSEAVECYTHAIELHQQNAVYFCNRAAAYSKLSNYVGAVQDCERAIVIDPNYSKAYGRMGLALTSLGKHEEAVEFYRRAVELDPDNEGYRGNLELAESRGREATSPQNATPPGGFDLAGILNNPGFMAMAANMMQNPQLQQMMSGMMSGGFSGGVPGVGTGGINDMAGLIQAGQQFAQTMQQENPELIEQLRSQIRSRPASASHDDLPPPYQPPPPPPPQPPSS